MVYHQRIAFWNKRAALTMVNKSRVEQPEGTDFYMK
jgi:hypothetical protein